MNQLKNLKLVISFLFVLLFSSNVYSIEKEEVKETKNDIVLSLEETPFKQAISLIYEDVLKRSYMVDPVILERKEKVSFSIREGVDKYEFFKRYLANFNVKVYTKDGIDYLKYEKPKEVQPAKPKGVSYVYTPKYRDVSYLSEMLSSFLVSSSSVNEEVKFKPSINSKGGRLIVHADKTSISKVKEILPMIDKKPKQIIVTARLVEAKKTQLNDTGLNLIVKTISDNLNLNLNLGSITDNFLNIKISNISAIFGMIDKNVNFNVVSSPILRIMDGETGNFTVGSDVPTIGSETTNNFGVTTKNINYISAGVIFDVKPQITEQGIKLHIKSELSDFTKTETGVNNTPTLLKRLVDSTVYLEDQSLIILGGLSEEKNTEVKDSFFFIPSSIFGKSKKFEKSDILLLLHVKEVEPYGSIDIDEQIKKQHTQTYKALKGQ
ncbi:type II secretion system protein [Inovirus D_HF32_91]|nr:type II secretion system protein [Inovirus D_HF32_91]